MPQGLTIGQIRERVRRARRWQEHSRLVYEVLHSSAKEDFQYLVDVYRETLQQTPTPLVRWAFADLGMEIRSYNINRSDKYGITLEAVRKLWDTPRSFEELRRVVRESPHSVIGYMGLARAYRTLPGNDPEIAKYERVIGERTIIVEIDGKKIPQKAIEVDNPEQSRRYRMYMDKVKALDPLNPYLSYWEADRLYAYLGGYKRVVENLLHYTEQQLAKLSKEAIALEGLKHAKAAYENGFKEFSPIVALGSIIHFAYLANRQNEMKRWGEVLKPLINENPQSPYVAWLRAAYSHSCPYIKMLTR
ncbi:MAG: hypothetical protein KatS3mg020_0634 [Fimbriimonadales bacterium]|nr:MAG: hypothetical protein KatS3mg019_1788 [Fimbriimonadales bacterium]GIV11143.1 MAG: hypothetical protein KatS3mg020_0634 [Fimbriimonadales bacterium]